VSCTSPALFAAKVGVFAAAKYNPFVGADELVGIKLAAVAVLVTATVLDNVAAPVTANVLERVAAPVTPNVPATAVLPFAAVTLNLSVFTAKSPPTFAVLLAVNAPVDVNAPLTVVSSTNVMLLVPFAFSVIGIVVLVPAADKVNASPAPAVSIDGAKVK
jgi:hypothetical protein